MAKAKSHERVNDILLGPLERPALKWLSVHMPGWVTPDILTIIGIIGAVIIFAGYVLSNLAPAFLLLATFGYFVNWFGDSMDGTIARYRKVERPKYGLFVDHTVDAFSQLLIFGALGLSPYVSFNVASVALVGYLLVSIYAYVNIFVTGVFRISYGKFGPTEIRMIAVILNLLFFFVGVRIISFDIGEVLIYDILVLLVALILLLIFIVSTTRRALELAHIGE